MPKYPKRGLRSLPPAMGGNAVQTVGTTQKRRPSRRTRPMLRDVMRLLLLDKVLHMAQYIDLAEENRQRGLYQTRAGSYPKSLPFIQCAKRCPDLFDRSTHGWVRLITEPTVGDTPEYSKRGLASMTPEQRNRIAAMGGEAVAARRAREQRDQSPKRPATRPTRPTLTEAMRLMLLEKPLHIARYVDLAEENRRRGLYQMRTGGYPEPHVFSLCAKYRPHLFDRRTRGWVRLITQPNQEPQSVITKGDPLSSPKPMRKYSKRGLASMTPERRKQIASMGGKAVHAAGTGHQYTKEEALKYGAMGGKATAKLGHAYLLKLWRRRPQPTLHEAMRMMLLDKPDHTARYLDLAEENRRRDLYQTKAGGYPIASRLQVRATAYPHWFDDLGDGKVRLKGAAAATTFARWNNSRNRSTLGTFLW